MKTSLKICGAMVAISCALIHGAFAQGGTTCATAVCITNGVHTSNNAFTHQWFAYKPATSGTVVIQSCGLTSEDTYVYLYSSCSNYLTYNDDYCGTQSYIAYSVTANQQYYIVWTNNYTKVAFNWSLSGPAAICTGLSVDPLTLDFGYTHLDTYSNVMSYVLSGTSLTPATGNVTITAPAQFQISFDASSGFGSTLTVPYSGGAMAGTTIYVRFHPVIAGTYSANIVNSGGGGPDQTIAVTGTTIYSPCAPQLYDFDFGRISNVTLASINNNRPPGYAYPPYYDYTASLPAAVIVQGETYPLSVSWTASTSYTAQTYVYFDWNNNAVLEDPGEAYYLGNLFSSGYIPNTYTGTIQVPQTVTTGVLTRMRVRVMNSNVGPCNQQYGEVHDYTVNIVPANNPPTAVCQDVTVGTNQDCRANVSASQVDNGSSDPDGDPITVSVAPSGPYQLGANPVTLTVTDNHGAMTVCTATISVIDNTSPVITCPSPITMNNTTSECGAVVTFEVTATDNCGLPSLTGTHQSGDVYPVGETTVTFTAVDAANNTSQCSFLVTVLDNEPPVITNAMSSPELWPPNHEYATIPVSQLVNSVSDNCGISGGTASVLITSVSSDEAEDAPGNGDGNTLNDMVIAQDCRSVNLRRERQGTGNGRVYTIHLMVTDVNGNVGVSTIRVSVPHNQNSTAIYDGQAYSVSGTCGSPKTISGNGILIPGYVLAQNYPNPFNPATTIRYELPMDSRITLTVHDLYGRVVVTLVNGTQQAGVYSVPFDGKDLPSGTYTYRLQTEAVTLTRVMSIVK